LLRGSSFKHLLPREVLLRSCYAEQEAEGNKFHQKQMKTHNKVLHRMAISLRYIAAGQLFR